ncbi:AMP-dependent synthetase and ligase [Candidatus Koribacter versatilis Ellin345]|uniref:AMP-dependent synthetase and ligase n=1 Tax=Koribacter versatilis (strain Ellin345) TaxID=204669 RepID=Q1ITR1_KORVE|nr:AMP-binding protein [Candidatus Koribacter versatilis]ABF39739.1 AMP-dependent synthetase and ligase [Candidatus Koribacter versatilis Ellin345]
MNEYPNLIAALEAAPGERPFVTRWVDDEDERETVTFAEFRVRARAQALALRRAAVGGGDRVVILMPQTIDAMAVFAGAMMIGAVPAFLAYPNFKVEPAKYRAGLAGVTANLSAKVIVLDRKFPEDMLGHVSIGEGSRVIRASAEIEGGELELSPLGPNEIAFIQHSAGTTGLQKGVALTHAAVLRQLQHLADALRIDPQSDSIYSWLPLYHDMGLIACFMLPMVCHIPVVMQSSLDWVMQPESLLQAITTCKCTLGWMPNFAFQFVPRRVPQKRWADYDLSSLRALINCSEPVHASSLREFESAFAAIGLKKGVLQSSYAMAENVFAITQSKIGREPTEVWADGTRFRREHVIEVVESSVPGAVSFASSGSLLPCNEVQIVNDAGEPLAPERVGEILIRSDSLFTGYFNRPDLTSAAFVNGWYRTGDLGFPLNDELYVVGRQKDLLIVGGENLYPQDIEDVVATHPAIHDGRVVAMGLYNPELGTEDIVIVAEVEREELLAESETIEQEVRKNVVAVTGVAPRRILLKPPRWIVKSTAGKAARSATRDKLLQEHPEFGDDA